MGKRPYRVYLVRHDTRAAGVAGKVGWIRPSLRSPEGVLSGTSPSNRICYYATPGTRRRTGGAGAIRGTACPVSPVMLGASRAKRGLDPVQARVAACRTGCRGIERALTRAAHGLGARASGLGRSVGGPSPASPAERRATVIGAVSPFTTTAPAATGALGAGRDGSGPMAAAATS